MPSSEMSGPPSRETVVFVAMHAPSVQEFLPIAERLRQEARFRPLFLYVKSADDRVGSIADSTDIEFLFEGGAGLRGEVSGELLEVRRDGRALNVLRAILPRSIRSFLAEFRKLLRIRRRARRLLETEEVVALVTVGDRHVGWETALVAQARRKGIPTLIAPVAMSAPEGAARLRRSKTGDYAVGGRLGRQLLAHLFPRWVFEDRGRRWFFYLPPTALAATLLGLMPRDPWTIAGGRAECMAVESEWARRLYAAQAPAKRLIVTGRPTDDAIHAKATTGRVAEVRAAGGGARVLLAMPQLVEHSLLRENEHWEEVGFLLQTISEAGVGGLTVALHPKSRRSEYEVICTRYGATIGEGLSSSLIPKADVFVATFSTLVHRAIALGKPTVVVDFYDLGYTVFDDAPGVFVVREKEGLGPLLRTLRPGLPAYEDAVTAQRSEGADWALLDGRCTERVARLLESMIDGRFT